MRNWNTLRKRKVMEKVGYLQINMLSNVDQSSVEKFFKKIGKNNLKLKEILNFSTVRFGKF